MAIRDRDRKVLWGRAGDRCAKCRGALTPQVGTGPRAAIAGEECHIVSERISGPRHGPPPEGGYDSYHNLILLCPTDHALVDQLPGEFPVSRLREMKSQHERWVGEQLDEKAQEAVIRRGAPSVLVELHDASELIGIVAGASEYGFDHDAPETDAEVELLSGFLQLLQDWGELWTDLEAADRVHARYKLENELSDIRRAGWRVFGARGRGALGTGRRRSDWVTAYIHVVRRDSPAIITSDLARSADQQPGD